MQSAWREILERTPDAFGLMTQWVEMMEESRAKFLANGSIPLDPLSFFIQWYNATSEMWSTIAANAIGRDSFIESSSRMMDAYTSFYGTFRKYSEESLHNLQMPTRSDVARVAGLVVALEEKVDRIEDVLDDTDFQEAGPEANQTVEALERRLGLVEGKLDRLLSILESNQAIAQQPAPTVHERAAPRTATRTTTRSPRQATRRAKGGPAATAPAT
jgi:polyhydroxyalkanoic acid synthase PhaR subunit